MSVTETEKDAALRDCVGALQFILAFYVPNQRALDTQAWKQACASGVAAYHKAASVIGWTTIPYRADCGAVYRDEPKAERAK